MRRQKMKMGVLRPEKDRLHGRQGRNGPIPKRQDELAEHPCDAVSARYAVVSIREGRGWSRVVARTRAQVAPLIESQEDGGPPRDGCDLVRAVERPGRVPDGAPARAPGTDAASSVTLNLNL